MSTLTLEMRESYVSRIHILFNGTLAAHESQITEEVAEMVDRMFLEITQCHHRLAGFAMAAKLIANALDNLVPNELRVLIGQMTLDEYILNMGRDWFYKVLPFARERNASKALDYLTNLWLEYTQTNQRMMACINQARRNHHSALALALMGI